MGAMFNAREREEHEWKPLFERADGWYRFKGIHGAARAKTDVPGQSHRSSLSLIEAVWEG